MHYATRRRDSQLPEGRPEGRPRPVVLFVTPVMAFVPISHSIRTL